MSSNSIHCFNKSTGFSLVLGNKVEFSGSEAVCQSLESDLGSSVEVDFASVRNQEEFNFIIRQVPEYNQTPSFWIGLSVPPGDSKDSPDSFVFSDGFEDKSFFAGNESSPWAIGQPAQRNDHRCVVWNVNFNVNSGFLNKWNDIPCDIEVDGVLCRISNDDCFSLIDNSSELFEFQIMHVAGVLLFFSCFCTIFFLWKVKRTKRYLKVLESIYSV